MTHESANCHFGDWFDDSHFANWHLTESHSVECERLLTTLMVNFILLNVYTAECHSV